MRNRVTKILDLDNLDEDYKKDFAEKFSGKSKEIIEGLLKLPVKILRVEYVEKKDGYGIFNTGTYPSFDSIPVFINVPNVRCPDQINIEEIEEKMKKIMEKRN